jgi:hypothetical protein
MVRKNLLRIHKDFVVWTRGSIMFLKGYGGPKSSSQIYLHMCYQWKPIYKEVARRI